MVGISARARNIIATIRVTEFQIDYRDASRYRWCVRIANALRDSIANLTRSYDRMYRWMGCREGRGGVIENFKPNVQLSSYLGPIWRRGLRSHLNGRFSRRIFAPNWAIVSFKPTTWRFLTRHRLPFCILNTLFLVSASLICKTFPSESPSSCKSVPNDTEQKLHIEEGGVPCTVYRRRSGSCLDYFFPSHGVNMP